MNAMMAVCENCGQPLDSETSVCRVCDKHLRPAMPAGQYRCPQCQGGFEKPVMAEWPPNQKWYKPSHLCESCPHCGTFLTDRYRADIPKWEMALLIVWVCVFWFTHKTIMFAVYVPWMITVLYRNYRARKSVSDPTARYKRKALPGETA